MYTRLWGLLLLIVLLSSCDSRPASVKATPDAVEEAPMTDFQRFTSRYHEAAIPYLLPDQDTTGDSLTITADYLERYMKDTRCRPLFGDGNDVPELRDNLDNANIYYISRLKGEHYIGLISQAVTESSDMGYTSYYYLTTFTPDGKFIDGMCVAYEQVLGKDRGVRKFEIKPDRSIEILQEEMEDGKVVNRDPARFLEIDPDGHINNLRDNSLKMPS